jgi:uncharacterized protein
MTYLLDINVLIALIDPAHIQHNRSHEWFAAIGSQSWATCPLTENGVLRIVSHDRYPNSPGGPAVVAPVVQDLRTRQGHTFWPDDISLLDRDRVDAERLLTASQITDSYLLALAVAHGGRLATFDRRLVSDAVYNGARSLHLIG